jgi:hypothetical protein
LKGFDWKQIKLDNQNEKKKNIIKWIVTSILSHEGVKNGVQWIVIMFLLLF